MSGEEANIRLSWGTQSEAVHLIPVNANHKQEIRAERNKMTNVILVFKSAWKDVFKNDKITLIDMIGFAVYFVYLDHTFISI